MFDLNHARADLRAQIKYVHELLFLVLDSLDGLTEDNFEPVANNLINASINARDALGLLEKGKKRQ